MTDLLIVDDELPIRKLLQRYLAAAGYGCRAAENRIFDPFFTTKPVGKGTGQGLAIAHTVIGEKHGGTIVFESREGEGTTFVIALPLQPDRQAEPDPGTCEANPALPQ